MREHRFAGSDCAIVNGRHKDIFMSPCSKVVGQQETGLSSLSTCRLGRMHDQLTGGGPVTLNLVVDGLSNRKIES